MVIQLKKKKTNGYNLRVDIKLNSSQKDFYCIVCKYYKKEKIA